MSKPFGSAVPCPYCGLLLAGDDPPRCPRCKLALDARTRRAVERQLGPWFLLDEQNPMAPGVSWQKLLSLLERGKLGPMSIVRGPATGGFWKLARQAPSVATQLGLCWSCQAPLADAAVTTCDRCGVATNGPAEWPADAKGGAAWAQEADDVATDLLRAMADAQRSTPAYTPAVAQSQAASGTSKLVIGGVIVVVAVVAILAAMMMLAENSDGSRKRNTDSSQPPSQTGPGQDSQPPGPKPDMFPRVRPYRELPATQQAAAGAKPQPPVSPPSTPAPAPDTTPAVSEPEEPVVSAVDMERQIRRQKAADAYALARRAISDDDLRQAERILVELFNGYRREEWPAGAEATLKQVQARIAASRPSDEPSPELLARQRQSANRLFALATAREQNGELQAAQQLLLQVLNDHHPKAWPEGAEAALKRVQKALARPTTTSAPKFFGVDGK